MDNLGARGQPPKRRAQLTNTTRLNSRSESVPILRLYSQIAEEPIGPRAQESEGEGRIAAEIPLSEERVKVGKRTVGAGEVRVRKNVSTEQVNVPVELKRENVVIEKIPGQQMEQTGKEPFQEEQVEVPLSREEPVVEKEIHVTGGVRVRRTEEIDQETIQESARREDVDIDEMDKASRLKRSDSGTEEKTM